MIRPLATALVALALAAAPASAQPSPAETKEQLIEKLKQEARAKAQVGARQKVEELKRERELEEQLKAEAARHDAGAPSGEKAPPKPQPTNIVEETEKHELREAMLDRLLSIAREKKSSELTMRVQSMREKEDKRHRLVLERLAAEARARTGGTK